MCYPFSRVVGCTQMFLGVPDEACRSPSTPGSARRGLSCGGGSPLLAPRISASRASTGPYIGMDMRCSAFVAQHSGVALSPSLVALPALPRESRSDCGDSSQALATSLRISTHRRRTRRIWTTDNSCPLVCIKEGVCHTGKPAARGHARITTCRLSSLRM
jgi:hypothetical protein